MDNMTRAMNELTQIRRLILGLALGAAVIAAILIAIHPSWALGAPSLIGGVLLAFRPTYKKRRERALNVLRGTIPASGTERIIN
jgi:hypothetical protein